MIKIPISSEKLLESLVQERLIDAGGSFDDIGLSPLSYDAIINKLPDEYEYLGCDIYRQVGLGGYGILDVLCVHNYCIIPTDLNPQNSKSICKIAVLIELKNVPLKPEDFNQVFRYVTALEETSEFSEIHPVLIGSDIGECHFMFNHLYDKIRGYTFLLGSDGLNFHPISNSWVRESGITQEDLIAQLEQKRKQQETE